MGSLLSRIETVSAGSLEFYPGNARRGDVGMIAESLRENQQYAPLVVQKSTRYVLAGNHTLKAALSLGWGTVDVVFVDVDDARARKIVLSSNRTADAATYDDGDLAALLQGLDGDYAGTGWDEDDLAGLLGEDDELPGGGGSDDASPDPPDDPVSAPGDLWLLGPHRLYCGDATNPEHLKTVTEGLGEIGIVYTDPPYGVSIVSGASVGGSKPFGSTGGKVIHTTRYMPVAGDDGVEVASDTFRLLTAEYPAALQVWWGGNHFTASAGLPDASCWLVWDKENTGNFADCELAWTNHPGAVRIFRHMWNGMLRASEHGKRVHPTQKPCALAEWALNLVDPKAERKTVLDVFGGSGSTLIAAHRTGRTAAIVECEAAYVDVIAARWQAETSITPERVLPDGSTEPVSFT